MHDQEDREHREEYASMYELELSEGFAFVCGGEWLANDGSSDSDRDDT